MISAEELMIEHRLLHYMKRAAAAEDALAERDEPCRWDIDHLDENIWYTTCARTHPFTEDGTVQGYLFCPYCRRPIEVAP